MNIDKRYYYFVIVKFFYRSIFISYKNFRNNKYNFFKI